MTDLPNLMLVIPSWWWLNILCRYKLVLFWPRTIMLRLTVTKYLVPQDIWRYRRGVANTDVVITGFDCSFGIGSFLLHGCCCRCECSGPLHRVELLTSPHGLLSLKTWLLNWKVHEIWINPLAPELFFLISAHPVYKMWIIQEPNKSALWNKLHFEEKKRRV